jgi:hypothetical protein
MSDAIRKLHAEKLLLYNETKKAAEIVGIEAALLAGQIWTEEVKKRFPTASWGESDLIIEIGFGTDPAAIVAMEQQIKEKGLNVAHIEKDTYGLRICCEKVETPDGTPAASRAAVGNA